jgi:hypothetical protein
MKSSGPINFAILFLLLTFPAICISQEGSEKQSKKYPIAAIFHEKDIEYKGNRGDNWCQTWAADGHIYTLMDDGSGWWGSSQGSMFIRIENDSDFTNEDVKKMAGWPQSPAVSPLYAYGTVSVDGIIYVWLWKSEQDRWYHRPIANRLLYTKDFGETFYRWDGQKETDSTFNQYDKDSFFFYKEDPVAKEGKEAYAFNWIAFAQSGQDNSLARDDYVYMYAPEQYDPSKLAVIRVPKDQILEKDSYEYFKAWNAGKPEWTKDMRQRGVNLQYPENRKDGEWMWPSWFPSVVYNKGLDLYIMASYGITDEDKVYWDGWCRDCKYPASLGLWYAENPWGPWEQFYYSDYFYAGHSSNRTYGFKLSPKWISDDGTRMTMIWSDARDKHGINYKWNQMPLEIILKF